MDEQVPYIRVKQESKFNPMKIKLLSLSFLLPFILGAQSFTDFSELLSEETFSSHAVVVCDLNNDGLDDISVLNGGSEMINYYQQANGDFTTNIIGELGDGGPFGFYAWGMCAADIDRNGERDVFAGGAYDGLILAEGDGDGENYTLDDIQNIFLFVQGCNFVDINRDGDIDLFICHDDGESAVLYNDGNGNFSMNYDDLNTALYGAGEEDSGNYGSVWSDVNNDGMVDLYISKCRQGMTDNTDPRRINQMWFAQEDGSYMEVGAATNTADGAQSWSADFGDIDNDGDMDLFIGNHTATSRLMINDGNGVFEDISESSGIADMMNFLVIQTSFRDFDNDGWIDILVTGGANVRLAHNNGDNTFTALEGMPDYPFNSFGLGDLNNDGYQDILAIAGGYGGFEVAADALWINDGGNNNWIAFDLEGFTSNIDAIGARVTIEGPFGTQIRDVKAGESYGIQHSLIVHFGLGELTQVVSATITWPNGEEQIVQNPTVNMVHEVLEGTVSVDELTEDLSISIYPNPAQENVQLNLNELAAKNYNLEIIDLNGKLIVSQRVMGAAVQTIDLTALNAGLYTVKVYDKNQEYSLSLVKK